MYLTLQRPERLNSLTPEVIQDMEQALAEIEARKDIRAVVLAGAGRAFSVGMDIDFLRKCFADVPGVFTPFCHRFGRLLRRIEAAPAVFLAVVDGLARAGGFELLLACDLVLASTRSRIGDDHIQFGMIPGAGAVPRAVRKLGDQRARQLLLTGKWLEGQQIADYGVAGQVVPPDQLGAVLEDMLSRLRPLSVPCLGRMKHLINQCADVPLADGLDLESAEFSDYHATEPTSADGFFAWLERPR